MLGGGYSPSALEVNINLGKPFVTEASLGKLALVCNEEARIGFPVEVEDEPGCWVCDEAVYGARGECKICKGSGW